MNIAMIQLEVSDAHSREERFAKVEGILQQLAESEQRPDLALLPEIWGSGFFRFRDYAAHGEVAEGETYQFLAPWAEKMNCHILGGSIIEREGNNSYNTSLLIDPQGKLINKYRKMHLFGYRSEESRLLTPGSAPVVVKTELGVLGLATCYDLRFPELFRNMSQQGAEMFLVVSAWPLARLDHFTLLNRARALENQCYMLSCNCAGQLKGHPFAGNSMIVEPTGVVQLAAGVEPTVLQAEIDLQKVIEFRATFPVLKDRVL